MSRHTFRADLGVGIAEPLRDLMRDNACRAGCLALLQAQLRAGAHLLPTPLARRLATTVGLHAVEVRASTDPTRKTKGTKA